MFLIKKFLIGLADVINLKMFVYYIRNPFQLIPSNPLYIAHTVRNGHTISFLLKVSMEISFWYLNIGKLAF